MVRSLTREQQIAFIEGAEERHKRYHEQWLKHPGFRAALRRQHRVAMAQRNADTSRSS